MSVKLVQTGVTRSSITQVTSGLAVGDTVVLADRTASLPSNSSTSNLRGGQGGSFGAAAECRPVDSVANPGIRTAG